MKNIEIPIELFVDLVNNVKIYDLKPEYMLFVKALPNSIFYSD